MKTNPVDAQFQVPVSGGGMQIGDPTVPVTIEYRSDTTGLVTNNIGGLGTPRRWEPELVLMAIRYQNLAVIL